MSSNKKRMSLAVCFWAEDRLPSPCLHIFVVGVRSWLLRAWFGRKERLSVAVYRLEVGGGTWPAGMGLFLLACTSGPRHAVAAGKGGALLRSLWTFLCVLTVLICFLRLFIEKLPKHRDYKSAVIPEKKDTLKVGLHFHWCPSNSFAVAHTDFRV